MATGFFCRFDTHTGTIRGGSAQQQENLALLERKQQRLHRLRCLLTHISDRAGMRHRMPPPPMSPASLAPSLPGIALDLDNNCAVVPAARVILLQQIRRAKLTKKRQEAREAWSSFGRARHLAFRSELA